VNTYDARSGYKYVFNEDGVRLYVCYRCLDCGFVHPLKEDGKPDYEHAKPCQYCNGGDAKQVIS
jgi:hypothetical protein